MCLHKINAACRRGAMVLNVCVRVRVHVGGWVSCMSYQCTP